MATAHWIPSLSEEEDVYAAEETKVHTLSRQAIAEMLDIAERQSPISSAPPPPLSGVRTVSLEDPDGSLLEESGERPAVRAGSPAIPALWDDEGLEPTRLSERMLLVRPALVTELMEKPPVILCATPSPPEPSVFPSRHAASDVRARAVAANDVTDAGAALDRRLRIVTLVAFFATLVPGLVLVRAFLAGL